MTSTAAGTRYSAAVRDGTVELRDAARSATAEIQPDAGFNCVRFVSTADEHDPSDLRMVIRPPASAASLAEDPFAGGVPILFPFPNRVRDGVYRFGGRKVEMRATLDKGWDVEAGHAFATLVVDKPWRLVRTGAHERGAWAQGRIDLHEHPDIFEQYPFRVRVQVRYTVHDGRLRADFSVSNIGDRTLPMGLGIHPWVPTAKRAGSRAPAMLRVPARRVWELNRWMPTGRRLDVGGTPHDLREGRPLAAQFYDDVWTDVVRSRDGWSETAVADPDAAAETYVRADPSFREWCIYAPVDDDVVCPEPYTCVTDAVNLEANGTTDTGLVALRPHRAWRGSVLFGARRLRESP